MITLELTEEEVATLIDALGTWMELPEECEGDECVRRQGAGADLDMYLREALHRRHDRWVPPRNHNRQQARRRD